MTAKDKEELVLNPITGQLDLIRKFNPDRIITSEYNAAGGARVIWDVALSTWVEDGPVVIMDSNGNVVTT